MYNSVDFSILKGMTITEVAVDDNNIIFTTSDNRKFLMSHHQDCCEGVSIEDINGDWEDILNTEILLAEESISNEPLATDDASLYQYDESHTWTFYKLHTIKGDICIRWYGSSNGYYSESVDFEEIPNG